MGRKSRTKRERRSNRSNWPARVRDGLPVSMSAKTPVWSTAEVKTFVRKTGGGQFGPPFFALDTACEGPRVRVDVSNVPPAELEALKARLRAAIDSAKRSDQHDVSPVDAYVSEGTSSDLNYGAERMGAEAPSAGSPRWAYLGGKMFTSDELASMAATPKEEEQC